MAIAGDHFMLNRVTEVGQETRCGVIHALSIRQLPICLILTSITQWTLINGLSKDYPVYNVAEMPLPWRDTGRSYMLSRAWDGNHMAVICLFPEIALSSVEWQLVYGGSLDSEHRFREVKHWADQLIITLAFVGIESHTGRRPQNVISVQKNQWAWPVRGSLLLFSWPETTIYMGLDSIVPLILSLFINICHFASIKEHLNQAHLWHFGFDPAWWWCSPPCCSLTYH